MRRPTYEHIQFYLKQRMAACVWWQEAWSYRNFVILKYFQWANRYCSQTFLYNVNITIPTLSIINQIHTIFKRYASNYPNKQLTPHILNLRIHKILIFGNKKKLQNVNSGKYSGYLITKIVFFFTFSNYLVTTWMPTDFLTLRWWHS